MVQTNILILIGIIGISYIIMFLLVPKDITDYTVTDTEYWRETKNRVLLKTAYDYNDKDDILSFPKTLGEWKGSDFKYSDYVYSKLNADILMSRTYKNNKSTIWMDIINSKTGESFHKQKICVEGAGWNVDNEDIAEFDIANPPNPSTKLYTNRLYIRKGDKKQVMIYWFMFEKFGDDNSVTMIRLSSPIRNNDTQKTLYVMKNFIENELFKTMYKTVRKDITNAEYLMDKYLYSNVMTN